MPIPLARDRLAGSGMGCPGGLEELSRINGQWPSEACGWGQGGAGEGCVRGKCIVEVVGASKSVSESPPEAALPPWVGVAVGILAQEGVGEEDSYRWGGEAPSVFPISGGEPEGSKGPVGPRKSLTRGSTPWWIERLGGGGGVVGRVRTPRPGPRNWRPR